MTIDEKDAYRAMVDRVNNMRDDGTVPGEPKRKPSAIDSPFNACCYREHCMALETRALAAEAAFASERERMLALVEDACATPPSDFAGMELEAFHRGADAMNEAIAAAIRAQGE